MSKDKEIQNIFQSAPISQIDRVFLDRLLDLNEGYKSHELLLILDEIVNSSGASDFVVKVLDIILNQKLKEEGLTFEQARKKLA